MHKHGRSSRIVQLIATMEGGGAERQLSYLAPELVRRGWDVDIITLRPGGVNAGRATRGGVRLSSLRHPSTKDPRAFWDLIQILRSLDPAVVQTWLPFMDIVGGSAANLMRVPWVATERNDPSIRTSPLDYRTLVRRHRILRGARVLVTNSERAVSYYRSLHPAGRCVFVENGYPLEELRSVTPADRSVIGVGANSTLVVSAGRLTQQKDMSTFVRALPLVLHEVPDVHFAIFGVGALRESLERTAEGLGVGKNLHLPGYSRGIAAWFRAANAVVSASLFEGSPNAVVEAMACGAPLVLSDIPAHRGVAADAALFFPARDPRSLAQQICSLLLEDPAKTQRRVDIGARLLEPFSIGSMADGYEDVYRTILAERIAG
jgi:glycosyltransferase involved in cell wall biosynthesis